MLVRIGQAWHENGPSPHNERRYLAVKRPTYIVCASVAVVARVIRDCAIRIIIGSVQHCSHLGTISGRSEPSVRISGVKHYRPVAFFVTPIAFALSSLS